MGNPGLSSIGRAFDCSGYEYPKDIKRSLVRFQQFGYCNTFPPLKYS